MSEYTVKMLFTVNNHTIAMKAENKLLPKFLPRALLTESIVVIWWASIVLSKTVPLAAAALIF